MKTTRSTSLLLIALAGFFGFAATGCNSVDHRNADSAAVASETDVDYAKLDASLNSSIARLEALKDTPGSPESYLAGVTSVHDAIHDGATDTHDNRESLRASGDKQIARLQEESVKISDKDLAKDFVARSEKLRTKYASFDKECGELCEHLGKADVALQDVITAVGAIKTDDSVKASKDSLSKAVSELKDARSQLPDARKALGELRSYQPQVTK